MLYVGPDQLMPVASVLASLLGFVLIFWTRVRTLLQRIFSTTKRNRKNPDNVL
jgi:hypothetical protein